MGPARSCRLGPPGVRSVCNLRLIGAQDMRRVSVYIVERSNLTLRTTVRRFTRLAILRGTPEVLEEFGGLQTALKRSVALEKQALSQPARGLIHRGSTWQTVRLSGARFR